MLAEEGGRFSTKAARRIHRTNAAIAALHEHLMAWPRDALVLASCRQPQRPDWCVWPYRAEASRSRCCWTASPRITVDDFWFLAHHAMALSEDGQLAAARPKIERSVAANPNNAHGAHAFAHVCYESGERDTARTFLSTWLTTYPRDGFFHGHLNWHLSLCELLAGNWTGRVAAVSGRHDARPA